jgi:hypothetical protein
MKKCFTEIKIRLIKKESLKVPVQELSFLIFGLNQQGNTFLMFVCFVLSHTSNFSAIWRLSPLPVTGLQI